MKMKNMMMVLVLLLLSPTLFAGFIPSNEIEIVWRKAQWDGPQKILSGNIIWQIGELGKEDIQIYNWDFSLSPRQMQKIFWQQNDGMIKKIEDMEIPVKENYINYLNANDIVAVTELSMEGEDVKISTMRIFKGAFGVKSTFLNGGYQYRLGKKSWKDDKYVLVSYAGIPLTEKDTGMLNSPSDLPKLLQKMSALRK